MSQSLSIVTVSHLCKRNDWFLQKCINKRSSSNYSHTVPIAQNYASGMTEDETVKKERIYL